MLLLSYIDFRWWLAVHFSSFLLYFYSSTEQPPVTIFSWIWYIVRSRGRIKAMWRLSGLILVRRTRSGQQRHGEQKLPKHLTRVSGSCSLVFQSFSLAKGSNNKTTHSSDYLLYFYYFPCTFPMTGMSAPCSHMLLFFYCISPQLLDPVLCIHDA